MKHIDTIDTVKVLFAGVGGFSFMLTEAEIILKVLIAIVTLGYIVRKWYKMEKEKWQN